MKKTSSSSSKSSSPSSWKLKRVIIENFKSINNADVSINQGFTSIFGPNGSGKSCFLEAIVFALGASLNNMRVESINQIKSTAFLTSLKRKADSSDNSKVTVTLFFNKDNTTKEISNSIVGNQRLHCIDKKKYGRGIFLEMVSDIFGFPRGDSFSYYISQRAVQAITQSSPKNLFQTISFSAGTHAIIEVRDTALKKLTDYEQQLKQIEENISELDADINLDQKAFQLLQTRTDISNEIKSNAVKLKQTEDVYKRVKALSHLELIKHVLSSILSLISDRENEEKTEDDYNSKHNTHRVQIDQIEETIDRLENELLLLSKNETIQRKQLGVKEVEETECRTVIASMEKQLLQLDCTLSFQRSQREELINTKIPGLFLRIDNLTKNIIQDDADPEALMKEKKKNLSDINDIYRYTESLLMALTDTALHEIKEETLAQNRLDDLDLSIHHATLQLKANEEKMMTLSPSLRSVSSSLLSIEVQDLEDTIKRDSEQLNRKIASLNKVMTNDLGIVDTFSNSTLDGDVGYLADILCINAKNEDFVDSLDMLIRPFLGVRVVMSRKVAIELMNTKPSATSLQSSSLRIWPLDSISSNTERSSAFARYINENKDIIDPKTFLSINSLSDISTADSNKLIFRIIDTWVFARSNKIVAKVLSENKNKIFRGIITTDGLRHTWGSITVSKTKKSNSNSNSIMDTLKQYQELRKGIDSLSASLKVSNTLLDSKKKLLTIASEISKLEDSISSMKDERTIVSAGIKVAEKKVTVIRLEVSKSRDELAALEDQRSQLIKALEDVNYSSVRMHQEQHKMSIKSANENLKKLEKDVADLGNSIMKADNDYSDILNNKADSDMKLVDILEDIKALKSSKYDYNNKINTVTASLTQMKKDLDELNSFKSNNNFNENITNIKENLQSKSAMLKELLSQKDDTINADITNTNTNTITSTTNANNLLCLVSKDIDRISNASDIDLHHDNAANIEQATRRELIVLRETSKELLQRQIANTGSIKKNTSALITSTNSKKKRRKRHVNDSDEDEDDNDDDEFEYARIAVSEKQTKVSAMKDRFDLTKSSVRILGDSLAEIAVVIARIQMVTFDLVRKRTLKYFSDLVPNKVVDLVLVGNEIKEGIQFVLLDSEGNSRSISELSGGQSSLLSLSFVIANAIHKQAPFYLLDEVDAALDESNQQAIARIIQNIFGTSQVLCVSHHQCFLDQATNGLSVLMKNNTSEIKKA